ncbi:MAG: 6,7-dimethyl-8-ribityllumazine synthase [Gemmatimonadaceae bacterium]|jgi:6,7-dimethyl-8-ribityllumazine synthase|nr:6,7-dimethyl-8-ribityllumazine synthase [Gemmatimonadaceae bacterium]
MAEFIGEPAGAGHRVVIVAARFNAHITEKLVEGAIDACVRHGVKFEDVDIIWVPGAWELPPAVMKALQTDQYTAVVALGAVVRGDTPHFDFVAGEASRGLALLQGEYGVPVGFGLLTCDTMEQAEARAGGAHGNKGWDSALAALEMADLFGRLDNAAGADE